MGDLKSLFGEGIVSLALLPSENDFLLNEDGKRARSEIISQQDAGKAAVRFHSLQDKVRYLNLNALDGLDGYTVPLIAHDYGAKTPMMWNALYKKLGLNIKNIMVVADPKNAEVIFRDLREDPKYFGGGAGVGFKERLEFLDGVKPCDLKAVNIIVKEERRLIGYNTDSDGFVRSLEDKLNCIGKILEHGNFMIVGAGGVAKEVAKKLAERDANYIVIVNRTFSKAVAIADELNKKYGRSIAVGMGENMTRGVLLNSEIKPDAVINLSDKGGDSCLDATFFYSTTDNRGRDLSPEIIEHISRDTIRLSVTLNPNMIYADIVLPSSGRSKSLRLVEGELRQALGKNGGGDVSKYILDGVPMVVYQAAPAYVKIQESSGIYNKKVSEDEALRVFKEVTKLETQTQQSL